METPAKNYALLELHVSDFRPVIDFYNKLGFKEVWQRTPEGFKGYLVLKKEDNILCFWAGNEMVWEQDFYNQVKNFANVIEPLQKRPWGLVDFRIEDPFGFYLRFTELHNILDFKYAVK